VDPTSHQPTTVTRFDNFNSGDMRNPCPVKGAG